MSSFSIKQGDTSPAFQVALSPTTVDLTGATVVFNMRGWNDAANKVDRQAVVIVTETGTPTVRYDWQAGDTDTAGQFKAEWEVTYADTTVETFPNNEYDVVIVHEDLG